MAEAVEVLSSGFMLERATADQATQTAIAVAVFVGMLFGGLASGSAADAFGRTPCLRWTLVVCTVSALAAAASPGPIMFVTMRLFAGVGVGAATPPLFALAAELAPPGRSGPAIVLVQSFWAVGEVFAAALALAFFGPSNDSPPSWGWGEPWRLFALAAAVVPALAALTAFTLVRKEPSRKTIIAGMCTPVATGVSATNSTGAAAGAGGSVGGEQDLRRGLAAVRRVCAAVFAPGARSRVLPLALVWFGQCFGYYGMSTWVTVLLRNAHVGDPYLATLYFALAAFPGNLASALLIDAIGRRVLLCASLGGATAAAVALSVVVNSQHVAVVALVCVFSAFSMGGWNALDVLSAESFPTEVRATALALLASVGRVASIIAQVVNGSLSHSVPVLLTVTSSLMGLACIGGLITPKAAPSSNAPPSLGGQ